MLILKDNSEKEWSYKRAITIVAYCYFDPIPVPLNVFYTLYTVTVAKCKKGKSKEDLSVREECFFRKITIRA